MIFQSGRIPFWHLGDLPLPIDSDWGAPDINRRDALVKAIRPDIGAEIIREPLGVIGVIPEFVIAAIRLQIS
ncbi:hypothetical protein [Rhizobium viscosum]|uniref:Uncharacterized protein n=1 Tax=Rhizobium viscosum TaxID=1673 RepID=A0ABR9ILB2_RHIVS|nr:hypothetical protein [Rhizobium viscosum]MBE1503972.1 hypothetical protein [Rhizobium viscosum]